MNSIASVAVNKMIGYFQNDVKRVNHALKVYGFAKSIAETEALSGERLEILEVAAVLHDIGIKLGEQQYHSSSGKYQEMLGPAVARTLLQEFNLQEKFIERVCYLIGHHHTYSKIAGIDFQILIEADFLVNIFEEDLSKQQIKSIQEKYFKTSAGTAYLDNLYLTKAEN
ncbi:HD superfamily phosphodiesterase [Sporomusaceae bacterium BoRhaA]|uniref:HD domain-containing protein n=1 Tax=Pelorhabdus rhamnosifermentans TaxID=2772457 RepID=UPI0028AD4353|nr:HD domain-containing protein [Pelorhabdus rhamnosifermentans]MBU2701781.1 HD superfamily phosphodiesterase [Pelorhabdus rhamnosifermentans]